MTRFQVKFQNVLTDYPEVVEEFMNNLRNSNSQFKDIDLDDIRWYYSWDFTFEDNEAELEMSRFDLKYEDRFAYELGKVKINVTMKAGQFKRRDRVNSAVVPKQIINIVDEVVKIMMIEEQKFFDNEEVVKSIPPINTSMYENGDYNIYQSYSEAYGLDSYFEEEEEEDMDYELDDILDKISSKGIDSLTKGEKNFLDNQSKS